MTPFKPWSGPAMKPSFLIPPTNVYDPAVRLAGARCVHLALKPPQFRFDWDEVKRSITERTRLIIINSPQKPELSRHGRARTWTRLPTASATGPSRSLPMRCTNMCCSTGAAMLGARARGTARAQLRGVLLRQDPARDRLAGRVLRCSRGYDARAAQGASIQHLQHRLPPLQHAIARYLSRSYPDAWQGLPASFFQAKRDLLASECSGDCGLEPVPAAGTYFQLIDYSSLLTTRTTDVAFADRLIREAKVATIPLSPFYAEPPRDDGWCDSASAKQDATLEACGRTALQFRRTHGAHLTLVPIRSRMHPNRADALSGRSSSPDVARRRYVP